jgi:hypothetical protein
MAPSGRICAPGGITRQTKKHNYFGWPTLTQSNMTMYIEAPTHRQHSWLHHRLEPARTVNFRPLRQGSSSPREVASDESRSSTRQDYRKALHQRDICVTQPPLAASISAGNPSRCSRARNYYATSGVRPARGGGRHECCGVRGGLSLRSSHSTRHTQRWQRAALPGAEARIRAPSGNAGHDTARGSLGRS